MNLAVKASSPLVIGMLLVFLAPQLAFADTVRRVMHPDGSVEFTNLPAARQAPLASSKKETIYRYQNNDGVLAFSKVRPTGVDFDVIRFECYACQPESKVDWHKTRLYVTPYQEEIETAAQQFDVDPALVRAVIHAESAFNPRALSSKGAQGLMQLMPGTADELGVSNAMDVAENIRGGANYLAKMLKIHNGDIKLATASYNAGPGAVARYGGLPPFAETRAYVKRVGILHQRYRQSYAAN